MRRRTVKRLLATALATAGLLAGTAALAPSAEAGVPVPSWTFHVYRTDGSLWLHSEPKIGNQYLKGTLPDGATVHVVCQVWGDADTPDNLPYHVWDRLTTNYYVYDYFITTPQPNGQFTPGIPRCGEAVAPPQAGDVAGATHAS